MTRCQLAEWGQSLGIADNTVVGAFGSTFIIMGALVQGLLAFTVLMAEKQKGLVGALRRIGMKESAHIASWLAALLLVGASSACLAPLAMKIAALFSPKPIYVFSLVSFPVHALSIFVLTASMTGLMLCLYSYIKTAQGVATTYSTLIFWALSISLTLIFLGPYEEYVGMGPKHCQAVSDSRTFFLYVPLQPIFGGAGSPGLFSALQGLLSLVPFIAYGRVYADLYAQTMFGMESYELEDLTRRWGPYEVLHVIELGPGYMAPSDAYTLTMMLFLLPIATTLVWYLCQIWADPVDGPRPWHFPFSLSYWLGTTLPKPFIEGDMFAEERDLSRQDGSIRVVNISKTFEGATALREVTLTAKQGEVLALLGPNGSGKTTLINILTGLTLPTHGEAYLLGCSIREDAALLQGMSGTCPQKDLVWDELSSSEHMLLHAVMKGVDPDEAPRVVDSMLARLGLSAEVHARVGTFSGGMKRRLSVGMSVLGSHRVLFLDEPTTGLDPAGRSCVWELVSEGRRNRVVVLTTHSMEEADALADKIAILHHGHLAALGSPLFLKNEYGSGYQISLLASSPTRLPAIKEVAKRTLPGSSVVRSAATSISISLNRAAIASIPQFLEEVQKGAPHEPLPDDGEELRPESATSEEPLIKEWGLSNTTLEEVFARICEKSNEEVNEERGTHRAGVAQRTCVICRTRKPKPVTLYTERGLSIIAPDLMCRTCARLGPDGPPLPAGSLRGADLAESDDSEDDSSVPPRQAATGSESGGGREDEAAQGEEGGRDSAEGGAGSVAGSGDAGLLWRLALGLGAYLPLFWRQVYAVFKKNPVFSKYALWKSLYLTFFMVLNQAPCQPPAPSPCKEQNYGAYIPTLNRYACNYFEFEHALRLPEYVTHASWESLKPMWTENNDRPIPAPTSVWYSDGFSLNPNGKPARPSDPGFRLSSPEAPPSLEFLDMGLGANLNRTYLASQTALFSNATLPREGGPLRFIAPSKAEARELQSRLFMTTGLGVMYGFRRGSGTGSPKTETLRGRAYNKSPTQGLLVAPPREDEEGGFPLGYGFRRGSEVGSSETETLRGWAYKSPTPELLPSPLASGFTGREEEEEGGFSLSRGSKVGSSETETFRGQANKKPEQELLLAHPREDKEGGFPLGYGFRQGREMGSAETETLRGQPYKSPTPELLHSPLASGFTEREEEGGFRLGLGSEVGSAKTETLRGRAYEKPTQEVPLSPLASGFAEREEDVEEEMGGFPLGGRRGLRYKGGGWGGLETEGGRLGAGPEREWVALESEVRYANLTWRRYYYANAFYYCEGTGCDDRDALVPALATTYDDVTGLVMVAVNSLGNAVLRSAVGGKGGGGERGGPEELKITTRLRAIPEFQFKKGQPTCQYSTGLLTYILLVQLAQAIATTCQVIALEAERGTLQMLFSSGITLHAYWGGTYLTLSASIAADVVPCLLIGYFLQSWWALNMGIVLSLVLCIMLCHVSMAMMVFITMCGLKQGLHSIFSVVFFLVCPILGSGTASHYGPNQHMPLYLLCLPPIGIARVVELALLGSHGNLRNLAVESAVVFTSSVVWLVVGVYGTMAQALPESYGPSAAFHRIASFFLSRRPHSSTSSTDGEHSGGWSRLAGQEEDEDVAHERERVAGSDRKRFAAVLDHIRKEFPHVNGGTKAAVEDLTLGLDFGDVFGLLGPNGAGKTTTISMLAGSLLPTSGSLWINSQQPPSLPVPNQGPNSGAPPEALHRYGPAVSVCPQHDPLWDDLTVQQHLEIYALVKGVPLGGEAAAAQTVASAMGLFGDAFTSQASTLSGGQKRRLSFGISTLGDPTVLLLDEMSAGLDPESKRELWEIVRKESHGRRLILLTTHSMEEADTLCSRIGIMVDGRLKCLGSPLHLKNRFGLGFVLTLVMEKGQVSEGQPLEGEDSISTLAMAPVDNFVLNEIARRGRLVRTSGKIRKYQIGEFEIAHLFQLLESKQVKQQYGIREWQLEQASLEDVWLRVADKDKDSLSG